MSCTSCLSNNDIQTPDQLSVPCTTPYFHKDTLTPPSSSRSPPLEGGGSSSYAARDAYLYNARPLRPTSRSTPHHLVQLISIAGYEAFVCVCFFAYKTLCAALYTVSVVRPSSPVCVFILREKIIKKVREQERRKSFFFK